MSVSSKLDGVTGRQPNVVAGVAVPQSDGVGNHGVRLGLLHASSRDDHGALCWYRRVIGKREAVRCRRDRTERPRGQGGQRARRPDRWFRGLEFAVTRIGLEAGPLSQWLYA